MRAFLAIIVCVVLVACAKQKTKDPIPKIEFIDFRDISKSKFTGADTATMVLSYEDGDGDIFVDNFNQGPNLVFTTYIWDAEKKQFSAHFDPMINDTVRYTTTVKQPDNGYYKGKSIRGEIHIPLSSFRDSKKQNVVKFSGFMTDMAGHKSNTFSSPTYTIPD